jgi:uncharacterized protein YifE (UPF0438 family)
VSENIFQLPEDHRKVLRRHYRAFYVPLDRGERTPETEAQQHFVAVCRGKLSPATVHEFAYMNFKKYCSLSGITEEAAVGRDFTFPAPEPAQSRTQKRREPPVGPQYSSVPCPRCARRGIRSLLVWRRARNPNVPGEFLGCSRFPHCRYTERE